jgi:glyoxylase-like metal-dependent hydrolase (beta-lactamase superfamily II)
MLPVAVRRISASLQDNYVWVLREPGGKVAVVDPSEAKPVAAALEQLGVTPDYILNTHHHWDHTGWVPRRLPLHNRLRFRLQDLTCITN